MFSCIDSDGTNNNIAQCADKIFDEVVRSCNGIACEFAEAVQSHISDCTLRKMAMAANSDIDGV